MERWEWVFVADSRVDKEQAEHYPVVVVPRGRIGNKRCVAYSEPDLVEVVSVLVPGRAGNPLAEHAPVDTGPHQVAGTLMAVGIVYRAVVGIAHREIVA